MENPEEIKIKKGIPTSEKYIDRTNLLQKAKRTPQFMMFVLAFFIVMGTGIGIIGLILYSGKSSETDHLEQQIVEKDIIIAELQKTLVRQESEQIEMENPLLHLDAGKCLNCEAPRTWTIVNRPGGFLEKCFSLHVSKHEVAGTISWDDLSELYWPDEARNTGRENVEINLSGQVVDIYIGGFGQTPGNENALFLMEDGSVEYISIRKLLRDGEFRVHGKVPGVEQVVKFYTAIQDGYHILAQRADGDYYDLSTILLNTGDYQY